jgi:hypothetical protein
MAAKTSVKGAWGFKSNGGSFSSFASCAKSSAITRSAVRLIAKIEATNTHTQKLTTEGRAAFVDVAYTPSYRW